LASDKNLQDTLKKNISSMAMRHSAKQIAEEVIGLIQNNQKTNRENVVEN